MAEAEWTEVSRREWITDSAVLETKCIVCGKEMELWFNGGELDSRECCKYRYSLEHVRIDFVIEKRKR